MITVRRKRLTDSIVLDFVAELWDEAYSPGDICTVESFLSELRLTLFRELLALREDFVFEVQTQYPFILNLVVVEEIEDWDQITSIDVVWQSHVQFFHKVPFFTTKLFPDRTPFAAADFSKRLIEWIEPRLMRSIR